MALKYYNMKIYLRKFFYFGIGIFLGVLVVKALFGGRDIQCSYFPNDRVLNDMRKKTRNVSPYAQCLMDCHLFSDTLFSAVFREAKIDFKYSEAREDMICKKYPLTWVDASGNAWDILTQNCTDELRVLAVKPRDTDLECICP